jgi:hypothetical protein
LAARGEAGRVVVATKIGHPPLDNPTLRRLDAASLRTDIEEALAHLGLPRLDLVICTGTIRTGRSTRSLGLSKSSAKPALSILRGVELVGPAPCGGAGDSAAAWLAGVLGESARMEPCSAQPGTAPDDLVEMSPRMLEWHVCHHVAVIPVLRPGEGLLRQVSHGYPG